MGEAMRRGANEPFSVRPLGHALGAEVTGLDAGGPISAEVAAALREVWHQHHLVLVRGCAMDPPRLIEFARCFGDLEPHDATPFYRLAQFPELLQITNREIGGKPSQTRNTGRNWHSDYAYTARPAAGAVLYAEQIPSVGGDTMFCNMVAAYQSLSAKMRAIVDDLEAVYDFSLVAGIDERDPREVAELKALNPPIAHPAARVHPDTGRRALYVSERVSHFHGMTAAESRPLIRYLCDHATRSENVYRHRWQRHDVLVWDNRSTMHIALTDFDAAETRHMLRATIRGEPSGFVV